MKKSSRCILLLGVFDRKLSLPELLTINEAPKNMSRFSTANLDNKFKFGNKNNNPVNNELLWKTTIEHENHVRRISKEDSRNPHVEVNPYRNLLGNNGQKEKQNKDVAQKLSLLQSLLQKEKVKRTALERQLDDVLGNSESRYSHLLDGHRRSVARASRNSHRRSVRVGSAKRRLRLPRNLSAQVVSSHKTTRPQTKARSHTQRQLQHSTGIKLHRAP